MTAIKINDHNEKGWSICSIKLFIKWVKSYVVNLIDFEWSTL